MPAICSLSSDSIYWRCKNFKKEYIIQTFKAGAHITNKNHIEAIKIHDKNEEYFPEGLASYFPRLNSLTITVCGLKSITRNQLKGLENLETLDLSSNVLKSLPDDLFTDMTSLKRILFQDNKLESMSSNLLEPILKNGLTLIDFQGNSTIDAFYQRAYRDNLDNPEDHSYKFASMERLKRLMNYCKKPADEQVQVSTIDSFEKDLASGFADLWASGELSDFTIIANGPKEFRVHKAVLSIRSSVFAAMFKNNMEEQQTSKMTISDFSAEAVEQFLACLYTGKIKDVSNAMELFALAAKYDVPKLRAASEQNVLQNIDDSNAYDVFALGHLHSSTVMKHKSFDIIKKTLPDVDLDDSLIAESERLKRLIVAIEIRNRKMQEVEDEFKSACI